MSREIDFLPDRLNRRPIIIAGMNDTELGIVLVSSTVFFSVLCALVGALLGNAVYGIATTPVWVIGFFMIIKGPLAMVKRNKPDGYHVLVINAWLEDRGLKPKSMIRSSKVWSLHQKRKNHGE